MTGHPQRALDYVHIIICILCGESQQCSPPLCIESMTYDYTLVYVSGAQLRWRVRHVTESFLFTYNAGASGTGTSYNSAHFCFDEESKRRAMLYTYE